MGGFEHAGRASLSCAGGLVLGYDPVMTAPSAIAAANPERVDQRVTLHGVPWAQYEALLAIRGDDPRPRMTYFDGELEFMSPSIDHEQIKKNIARLVEAWADILGLELQGYGSWTVRAKRAKAGAEADECYTLNGPDRPKRPDLAIEVVWTGDAVRKLQVWAALSVGEVWIYEAGEIHAYVLRDGVFVANAASVLLPGIDLTVLARLAQLRQSAAVRELRAIVTG